MVNGEENPSPLKPQNSSGKLRYVVVAGLALLVSFALIVLTAAPLFS